MASARLRCCVRTLGATSASNPVAVETGVLETYAPTAARRRRHSSSVDSLGTEQPGVTICLGPTAARAALHSSPIFSWVRVRKCTSSIPLAITPENCFRASASATPVRKSSIDSRGGPTFPEQVEVDLGTVQVQDVQRRTCAAASTMRSNGSLNLAYSSRVRIPSCALSTARKIPDARPEWRAARGWLHCAR